MKKYCLLSAFILATGAAYAQDAAEEAAQMQAEAVQSAEAVQQNAQTIVSKAQVFDISMDQEDTMKRMGRHFKALNKAKNTEEMKEPLAEFKKYSLQSEALGVSASEDYKPSDEETRAFQEALQTMNAKVIELEAAVGAGNFEEASKVLKEIDDIHIEGHDFFDIK